MNQANPMTPACRSSNTEVKTTTAEENEVIELKDQKQKVPDGPHDRVSLARAPDQDLFLPNSTGPVDDYSSALSAVDVGRAYALWATKFERQQTTEGLLWFERNLQRIRRDNAGLTRPMFCAGPFADINPNDIPVHRILPHQTLAEPATEKERGDYYRTLRDRLRKS